MVPERGCRWLADERNLYLADRIAVYPTLNTSVSNAGGSRPDRRKSGEIDNPTPNLWFDTSFNTADAAWGVPLQYTYGNGGRNILRGPGRINLDFSIFKSFNFTESRSLQFRAESFT